MATEVYKVQEGQNLFDVALQQFGDMEDFFSIFVNDDTIDVNTDIVAGQEIRIDSAGIGNNDVKTAYIKQQVITNNFDDKFIPNTGNYDFQDNGAYDFQDGDIYDFN